VDKPTHRLDITPVLPLSPAGCGKDAGSFWLDHKLYQSACKGVNERLRNYPTQAALGYGKVALHEQRGSAEEGELHTGFPHMWISGLNF
jgi:hypothetical protein